MRGENDNSKTGNWLCRVPLVFFVIFGIYAGVFLAGDRLYATVEGSKRPGFSAWSRIYQRVLFGRAGNDGFRYSEIDRVINLEATFESMLGLDEEVLMLNFSRVEGGEDFSVRWNGVPTEFPTMGEVHEVEIRVRFYDDGQWDSLLPSEARMPERQLGWWVEGELINVRKKQTNE